MAPASAGAADRPLYFEVTAAVSGYPIGGGQTISGEIHQLRVLQVQASLAGREPLCRAYIEGRLLSAGGRPAVVTPLALGDIAQHSFEAFGIYVRPLSHGARSESYGFTAARPDGEFPSDPGTRGTNDPFWIDFGRYLGPATIAVTLRRDGSGSVIERHPHPYSDRWRCSARPPLSFSVLDAAGDAYPSEKFNGASSRVNERLTLAGEGFDPHGGPIELFIDDRRIARVRESESFRVHYELRDFPGGRCRGTFRAVQGRDRPHLDFSVRPIAQVEMVQGSLRTTMRRLRPEEQFCAGGTGELLELGTSEVVHAGEGVVVHYLQVGPLPHYEYLINSRPRGERQILTDLAVEEGRRLVVQMPHGDFTAIGPGSNPMVPPLPPGCGSLPAQTSSRVTLGRCEEAPHSVHLDGGADMEPFDAFCNVGRIGASVRVDGSIVIKRGLTITAHVCHNGHNPGFANSAPLGRLSAHDGAISISGGITDNTFGHDRLVLGALGTIILHG